jgi:hypothetical protein
MQQKMNEAFACLHQTHILIHHPIVVLTRWNVLLQVMHFLCVPVSQGCSVCNCLQVSMLAAQKEAGTKLEASQQESTTHVWIFL